MKRIGLAVLAAFAILSSVFGAFGQSNAFVLHLDSESRAILSEATEDRWFSRQAFVSTVLGGAIALIGGFLASWYAHTLQNEQKQREDAEFRKNLLRAIRSELEALGEVYDKGIGGQLAKVEVGQPFETRLAFTQDWFTVFTANAGHLGKLDGEMSKRIIAIYGRMKAQLEDYKINNELLSIRGQVSSAIALNPTDASLKKQYEQLQQFLVHLAGRLREQDAALKASVNEFFAKLDENQ